MKIINVALSCKPEKQAEYEAFIGKLVAASRAESGNLAYSHFKKLNADNEYAIIEHWRDDAAIEAHNQTVHFQQFLKHISDFVSTQPQVIVVDYHD